MGGIDIIIANISLEKNNGFSAKCWQKICTKFCKLSLKIAFFSQLLRGSSPSDTRIFFNGQKFIMPNKGINTRKVGGIDTKIVNILLKMKNGFQENAGKWYALIEFENCKFFNF